MILEEALIQVKTVAIAGHIRPDGDCVGSCMGLYQYLKDCFQELEIDVYLEEIPCKFKFIEATKNIIHWVVDEKAYDLFISLDCGDADRLGFAMPLFQNAKRTLCIDHHISNESFGQLNHIVPEASSTSELVYHLLDKKKITREIAECLYLGIVHDTGAFQYTATTPVTMEAAANLMRTGIDASKIIENTFYEKTNAQNKILGYALLESNLHLDGKCISALISQKDMEEFGVKPIDLEGIVSQLRITKGVEIAVFVYELQNQEYKVSLRSTTDADVSIIAGHFNGGGHKKAAGFTIYGNEHDVMDEIMHQVETYCS